MFISSCLHFFSLVAVFWLNVLSFDICRVFAQNWNARTIFEVPNPRARKLADKKRLKYYSIYAWGIPVIIVTCGHCLDMLDDWLRFYRPKYATHMCWINNPNGFALFFALPACSLFLENLVIFLITLILALTRRRDLEANNTQIIVQPIQPSVALKKKKSKKGLKIDKKAPATTTKDRLRRTGATGIQALHVTGVKFKITQHLRAYEMRKIRWRFGSYVVLAVVMTTAWTLLCALIYWRKPILIYPFAVLNGLQGVLIFFLFDLKPKIYFFAFEKIVGRPHPNYKKSRLRKLKLDKSDLQSANISRADADSIKVLQSVDDAENQKIGREAMASKSSEQVGADETPASMSIRKAKKKQWQGRNCAAHSTGSLKQKSHSSTEDNEVNNHDEGDALSNSEKFQDRNLSLSIENVSSSKSRKTISRRKRSKSAPPKKGPHQTANMMSRAATTTPTNTPVTGRSQKDANRGGHALSLFKRKPKADSYLVPTPELQKVKSEKSGYKKSKTDLAKYDAWQQLKIFQRSLSLEPNQEQADSEPIFQPLCQGNDDHKSANEHLQTQADKRSDKDESKERVERAPRPPRSQKSVAKLQRQFSFDKGSSISLGSSFPDDEDDDNDKNHLSLASSSSPTTQQLPKDHTRWRDLVVATKMQAKFLDSGTQTKLRKAQKRSRTNAKVDSFTSSRRHKSCSAMVDLEEGTTHDASCQTWTRDRVDETESLPISTESCTKSPPQVQREKRPKSHSAIFKMSTTSSGLNSAGNSVDGKMMTTRGRTRKTWAPSTTNTLHDRPELGRPTFTHSLSFDASTDSIYPDSLNWNNDSADLVGDSRANLVQSDTDISDTEVRAQNIKSGKPSNGLSGFQNNEILCGGRVIQKMGPAPSKFPYIWKPPPCILPESKNGRTNLKRLEKRVMGVQIGEKGRSNHETKPLRGGPSTLTETEEGPNGPSLTNSKNCLLGVVLRPSMEHQVQRREDEKAFPFSPEAIKHDYSSNLKPEGGFTRALLEEPTLDSDLSVPRTVPKGHADHFNGEATVFLCPPAYQTLPPKKHPQPPPYRPPPAYQPTTKANPIVLNQDARPVNPAFSLCSHEYVDCPSLDKEQSQQDNGHENSILYVTGHPEQGQESVV